MQIKKHETRYRETKALIMTKDFPQVSGASIERLEISGFILDERSYYAGPSQKCSSLR